MCEKDYGFTGYKNTSREKARRLRKGMTPQEKHLWYDYLKTYPIQFYRQRPIDYYIADFYCSAARLVIEIDGSQHYTDEGAEYDRIRTEILEKYRLQVLRFSNLDIDRYFAEVCAAIDDAVKKRISPSVACGD